MNCPICGTEMEIENVPSQYHWNNGLPKSLCEKSWSYYTCKKCLEERRDGKGFSFVILPNQIYTWESAKARWISITGWRKVNASFNPSRRCSFLCQNKSRK